jgi:hypothetical protein
LLLALVSHGPERHELAADAERRGGWRDKSAPSSREIIEIHVAADVFRAGRSHNLVEAVL